MSEKFPERTKTTKVSTKEEGYLEAQDVPYRENEIFGSGILGPYLGLTHWDSIPAGLKDLQTPERKSKLEEALKKQGDVLTAAFKSFLSTKEPEKVFTQLAATQFVDRGLLDSRIAYKGARVLLKNVPTDQKKVPANILATADILGLKVTPEQIAALQLRQYIKSGGPVPGDLWGAIVEGNRHAVDALEKELHAKYLPEIVDGFKTAVPDLLTEYGISAEDTESCLSRLNGIAIQVVDGLSANVESIGGNYTHEFNRVLIAAGLISERTKNHMQHVLNHEFFHVLSGRLLYKGERKYEDADEIVASYGAGRVGLRFTPPLWLNGKSRFRWLNEAVTERLSIELSEKQGHSIKDPAYVHERELLEVICTKGVHPIPFEVFVQAYFENYEPDVEKGENTIPAWRALRDAINTNFNSQFLIDLDSKVKKQGVKKVLEELTASTQDRI